MFPSQSSQFQGCHEGTMHATAGSSATLLVPLGGSLSRIMYAKPCFQETSFNALSLSVTRAIMHMIIC